MKALFLDIDGVLNTAQTFVKRKEDFKLNGCLDLEIDEFRLLYLKEIIDATNAKIVLSSAWRLGFNKKDDIIFPRTDQAIALLNLFHKYNLDIFDITPNFQDREKEIETWINTYYPEHYCIIDDEPTLFTNLTEHLV